MLLTRSDGCWPSTSREQKLTHSSSWLTLPSANDAGSVLPISSGLTVWAASPPLKEGHRMTRRVSDTIMHVKSTPHSQDQHVSQDKPKQVPPWYNIFIKNYSRAVQPEMELQDGKMLLSGNKIKLKNPLTVRWGDLQKSVGRCVSVCMQRHAAHWVA